MVVSMKNLSLGLILLFLFFSSHSTAQLSISTIGSDYLIDFDNNVSGVNNGQFTGSGFTPTPSTGQLNSNAWSVIGFSDGDLSFGGTGTSGDFARGQSVGGVTTGGIYSFEVNSTDYAFGIQPLGADWTPGDIILKVQNNSGEAITSFYLSYDIYVYNDQDRSNSFNFSYSADNINYTDVMDLDYASPELQDPSPAWISVNKYIALSDLNWTDGDYFYLKWSGDDVSGSGSRDEFALDNITINANTTVVNFVSSGSSVNEGDGSTNLDLNITNPSSSNSTTVEVALISGDPAQIDNYTTQTVTFPASSSSNQQVTINITDDSNIESDDTLIFEIQNISGGNHALIGTNSQFNLFIYDNDYPDFIINEILADPDATYGDANGDGIIDIHEDEFVEIINNESIPVDIADYTLLVSDVIKHTFPSNTIVAAGEAVVVFGGGNPTGIPGVVQVASSGGLILSNTSEEIKLDNPHSVIIDSYNYGSEANNGQSIARDPDISGSFVKHLTISTNPVHQSPGRRNTDNSDLPVELSFFSAALNDNGVKLNWKTETEVRNYGFDVERSIDAKNDSKFTKWRKIGFVNGNGNSNSPKEYSFTDNDIGQGKYLYRLKQIDTDGSFKYSQTININIEKSLNYSIKQNYPNPFNPVTTISYSVPSGSLVKLEVFNALGKRIKILWNGFREKGTYSQTWNANHLSSGIYFLRFSALNNKFNNSFNRTIKMVLIK